MFSSAFSAAFSGQQKTGLGLAFSGAFSPAFAGVKAGRVLICAQQAQAALLAGASWLLGAVGLEVGGAVLIGLSGKPMQFKSEETAASYVETVTIRAASEAGMIAVLPNWARDKWAARKVVSLTNYAERVWKNAARWAENTPERAALVKEASAADARAEGL